MAISRLVCCTVSALLALFTGLGTALGASRGIWISPEEVRALPMSGPAWDALKARADQPAGTPDLSNQDQNNNVYVLAKALVYARTGIASYRDEVVQNCMLAIGTELGGRTLALGRELGAYVIAADLVGLDPVDDQRFRAWLRLTLTEVLDSRTLQSTHEDRPNNWGTLAGGSRVAVAAYLGDTAELERAARVFKGWLGDRSSYAGFQYQFGGQGADTWMPECDGSPCTPQNPRPVNPVGTTLQGHNADGALGDDISRGGAFQWPPGHTGYVWEGLAGAVMQAEILARQGYDAWNWENQAMRRAVAYVEYLDEQFGGWWTDNDDEQFIPWVVNKAYGTRFRTHLPARTGKNMAWTDWTHASPTGPLPSDTTPPTVSITSPANGATVSGTITVSATASDNVSVAGVQLKLNGVNLGGEDTANPFSFSWNTATTPDGSRTLTAVARDAAGNSTTSAPINLVVSNTVSDSVPPSITAVSSSNVTSSGATVLWTSNKPADSQVECGPTTSYGITSPLQTPLVTSHSVSLSGLAASTLYHYMTKSRDSAGNLTISGDFTFTTAAATSGTVSVLPTVETDPSHHTGDTADDAAIWIHPTDPSQSLVIGDDKNGGLMVYGLDGRELQYVNGTNYNNLDLRYNFPLTGQFSDGTFHQKVALVGVGDELNAAIDFFKVNPGTRQLEPAGTIATSGLVPYGSCMYHSSTTGKYYYFVNAQSGVTQQWELRDGGGGNVTGTMVRQFDVGSQTEGCVADDVLGHFYIGEEAVGIWKYGAEPNAGSTRTQVDKTGTGGHLIADVEGLSIYYTVGNIGYLIASSQGNSTVAVYTRDGNNAYLGSFNVTANGTIDGVSGTDGLDVTNAPLGSAFPQGLFVLHDSANSGGTASNYKYVRWESVASALGLTIDTSWDPRRIGGTIPSDLVPPARIADLAGTGN